MGRWEWGNGGRLTVGCPTLPFRAAGCRAKAEWTFVEMISIDCRGEDAWLAVTSRKRISLSRKFRRGRGRVGCRV